MHVPIRTCVSCRRRQAQAGLVRLVVRDGAVVIDPDAVEPGRGAYVCEDEACLRAVLRDGGRRLLQRLCRPQRLCRSGRERARVNVDGKRLAAQWRALVEERTGGAARSVRAASARGSRDPGAAGRRTQQATAAAVGE